MKAYRAWNNKLRNINRLLWWLYDNDILTKTEQRQKDKVFRQYYRYHNDGDFPRALSQTTKLWRLSPKTEIAEQLELYVENFIKELLVKYWSKIDRQVFWSDMSSSRRSI